MAKIGFDTAENEPYVKSDVSWRATIMIAHIHALGVSFAAAFGPQVLESNSWLESPIPLGSKYIMIFSKRRRLLP